MRKVLAVIMILSLALMAFSCLPGNGSSIDLLDESDTNDVGRSAIDPGPNIPLSLKATILTTPTVEELLNALLDVEAIGNSTKETINIILDLLPELGDWLAGIPAGTLQAIDEIMGNVTELHTVAATTGALQDAINSGEYDDYEYLPEALEFGIELLNDGEGDLYNPDWDPYLDAPYAGSFNVSQMMKAALEGGIAGAVGAALADFALADYVIGIGGCVGAVNSLIADIISQLPDYW
jgi:hypothetical protein